MIFVSVGLGRVNETRDGGAASHPFSGTGYTLALIEAIVRLQRIIVFSARGCCRDTSTFT